MSSNVSALPQHPRIPVTTPSGTYHIEIGWGSASRVASMLDAIGAPARRFVVSNPVVWRLHGEKLAGVSSEEPILIPDGERFKNLTTVGRIYDALIRAGADRATTIVGIGGGVLGDVAGFAAATFLRGVPIVHVPTTLLAQVDSAVGGKVGVNHTLGKNLIGAFHQPRLVVVDPAVLETLPRREFRAGLYEVVKYGVIASRPLFDRLATDMRSLFARQPEALVHTIAECCRIKADVVERDERETGPRRALNFGHTVGHALEAVTRYRRFRHGEAVGYGMLAAARLAVSRGTLPEADGAALATMITNMGPLPPIGNLSAAEIVDATGRDKKVIAGRLHFVLPSSIGSTTMVSDVTREELLQAVVSVGARA